MADNAKTETNKRDERKTAFQRKTTGKKEKTESGASGPQQDTENDADGATTDHTGDFLDSYKVTFLGVLLCLLLILGGLGLIYYQVFHAFKDSPMRTLRKMMIRKNPALAGKSDSEIVKAAEKFYKILKSGYATFKS